MSLRSPSLKVTNQTLHEKILPTETYVLSLAQVAGLYAASASSPSNQIHLFDSGTLQNAGALKGHEQATAHLCAVHRLGASTRQMLLSSGEDGCVIAWDERSGSASIKMETSGRPRPLLCCDASDDGFLVAAGTSLQKEDAFIVYWDPRNPAARLRSHGSTHSDDITAVHFLKGVHASSSQQVLLSTSSDGLISTSDALEADEDEAVMYVGNWGCSISQGGWITSAGGTRVWAASDMETFSCWSDELDLVSATDIRNTSLHGHGHTWVTDYIITGYPIQEAESGLGVFVGSNEGDLALITSDLSDAVAPWTIHSVWAGGHSGIVRSLHWDEQHDVLVTGGEDSKIITWRIHTPGLVGDLIPDQSDDPMELVEPNVKRDRDDIMDVKQPGLQADKEVAKKLPWSENSTIRLGIPIITRACNSMMARSFFSATNSRVDVPRICVCTGGVQIQGVIERKIS